MTAHRRKDRPNEGYRIRPRLPAPWGRVGPWQTGLRRKDQANDVQRWIKEMARMRPELIDALVRGDFSLQDAWIAKLRDNLDELLAGVGDPFLNDAIAEFETQCTDPRVLSGLKQLRRYADENVRITWLKGANIRGVYNKALADKLKPNSVRRGLHRAVRELLMYKLLDEQKVTARFKGITVPGEDDTRVVSVKAGEVRTLLDHCLPDDFRWMVVAAITTAVDAKPLGAMTPRDIDEAAGTVSVPDTKSPTRRRIIRLSDIGMLAFRMAARGKDAHEKLWPWTKDQVRHLWENARDTAAGRPTRGQRRYRGDEVDQVTAAAMLMLNEQNVVTLPLLRFKDLRHLLPTVLAELGYDRREIQAYIGHVQGSKQTDRYITPTGDVRMLNAAAEKLGLAGANIRAVGE